MKNKRALILRREEVRMLRKRMKMRKQAVRRLLLGLAVCITLGSNVWAGNFSFAEGVRRNNLRNVVVILLLVFFFYKNSMQMTTKEHSLFLYEAFLYYNPFFLGIMMVFLWGFNLWIFTTFGVDYENVLGLDNNHLTTKDIWMCGQWMIVAVLSSMTIYFCLHSYGKVSLAKSQPILLCVATVLVLIVPCNTFYRSSRRCFFRRLVSIVIISQAIKFPDFFLIDILTSMAKVFADLACSVFRSVGKQVATQEWFEADPTCGGHSIIIPVVLVLPFFLRFLLCLRQFYDKKEKLALWNALKYFITMMSIYLPWLKYFVSEATGTTIIQPIWIFSNVLNTIYSFVWDITLDWALQQRITNQNLQPNKHKFKWVFYGWIFASDLGLRSTWIYNFSDFLKHQSMFVCLITILELLRRTQWIYFRVEAEAARLSIEPEAARLSIEQPVGLAEVGEEEVSSSGPLGLIDEREGSSSGQPLGVIEEVSSSGPLGVIEEVSSSGPLGLIEEQGIDIASTGSSEEKDTLENPSNSMEAHDSKDKPSTSKLEDDVYTTDGHSEGSTEDSE